MGDHQMTPEQVYHTIVMKRSCSGICYSAGRLQRPANAIQLGTNKLWPLTTMGRFNSPRCFHRMNKALLPVDYTASGNAWVIEHIFQERFQQTFVPTVRKHLRKMRLTAKAVVIRQLPRPSTGCSIVNS